MSNSFASVWQSDLGLSLFCFELGIESVFLRDRKFECLWFVGNNYLRQSNMCNKSYVGWGKIKKRTMTYIAKNFSQDLQLKNRGSHDK